MTQLISLDHSLASPKPIKLAGSIGNSACAIKILAGLADFTLIAHSRTLPAKSQLS